MAYTHATQAPNRQQWESSSAHSQAYNCGPSCVSFIAGFYTDSRPSIEYNRRLIAGMGPYGITGYGTFYGSPARTPTSAWQQRDMLIKRGVAASVRSLSTIGELHGLVDSGRRPTLIGIQMSRVPASVRGHSFLGWHAVVIISGAWVGGVRGFWVMDPNFAAGSSASRRFYSDAVMFNAWQQNSPRYAVVPTYLKALPVATTKYVKFNSGVNGVNLRTGPDQTKANIYAIAYSDANPAPNGIIRQPAYGAGWIGNTNARRTLYGTVKGPDGHTYNKLRLKGTNRDVYVQSRFMHRV